MGAEVLLGIGIMGAIAAGVPMAVAANKDAKAAKNAKSDAEKAAANQGIGNLSDEEAQMSASKRAFKKGLIFTSPTGTLGSGSRGRSRLTGSA